ncbi:MAG: serpin family protein [Blastocatellia bacterium]
MKKEKTLNDFLESLASVLSGLEKFYKQVKPSSTKQPLNTVSNLDNMKKLLNDVYEVAVIDRINYLKRRNPTINQELILNRVEESLAVDKSQQVTKLDLTLLDKDKSSQEDIKADNLANANIIFGLKLFVSLTKDNKDNKNIFISPMSIAMALQMTLNGASDQTKADIEKTLELKNLDLKKINNENRELLSLLMNLDPAVTISIANSLWIKEEFAQKIIPDFVNTLKENFDSDVESVPFNNKTVEKINNWVKDKTQDKIEQIVKAFKPEEILLLINALYFKGSWTNPFNASKTRDRLFFLRNGSNKECPFMYNYGTYRYYENEVFQAIALPYGNERINMYIFLPKNNVSLEDFSTNLTANRWQRWISRIDSKSREGSIKLPRFKIEYEKELTDVLSELGMDIAFNPKATFDNLINTDPDEYVYISKVTHKTFVEVNEEGTEAAAVTSVSFGNLTSVSFPFEMVVDRPFFCSIVDEKTKTILFMGTIYEP